MLSAERHFDETWLKGVMERMERRLQVTIHSSLEPIMCNVGDLKVRVTAIKEQVAPHEDDKQEDNDPLESGQWRDPLAEPYPAMGRELRASLPQGGPAPTKNYMGARSACFEQMDVDPSGDNDRQEPIIPDSSHNVGVDNNDPKSVNYSWKMHIEALFTSPDEAEWYKHTVLHTQPTKRQEICQNFLWTVHLYKLSDSYKICQGHHYYMFGEVISEFKGLLVWLNWASVEDTAEGAPPAEANTADECLWDSVPPYGGTTYRFATPKGSAHGLTPVWPGDDAAQAH